MMGRTALKITLAVAMAAGLLLGVSGCGDGKADTRFQSRSGKSTSCRGRSHISALFV